MVDGDDLEGYIITAGFEVMDVSSSKFNLFVFFFFFAETQVFEFGQ